MSETLKALYIRIAATVGTIYIILAVLGSIEIIDFKTCVSNAGRCVQYITPTPTTPTGDER